MLILVVVIQSVNSGAALFARKNSAPGLPHNQSIQYRAGQPMESSTRETQVHRSLMLSARAGTRIAGGAAPRRAGGGGRLADRNLRIHVDDSVCQYVKLKTHVKPPSIAVAPEPERHKCLSEFPAGSTFVGRMVNFRFDVPAASRITREMVEEYAGDDLRAGTWSCSHLEGRNLRAGRAAHAGAGGGRVPDQKGIRLFGQDNSIETGESTGGLRPHDMFLSSGIPLLEMLTNTSKLRRRSRVPLRDPRHDQDSGPGFLDGARRGHRRGRAC